MAANTSPIYTLVPAAKGALIQTAASVVHDISGTIGTDIYLLFTAGASGAFVQKVRFQYAANATTTSVACIIKLWISTVASGTPTIGTQAWFYEQIALPATGALSTTVPVPLYEIPFNFGLDPNSTILAKITVSQGANTGWLATVIGGQYA